MKKEFPITTKREVGKKKKRVDSDILNQLQDVDEHKTLSFKGYISELKITTSDEQFLDDISSDTKYVIEKHKIKDYEVLSFAVKRGKYKNMNTDMSSIKKEYAALTNDGEPLTGDLTTFKTRKEALTAIKKTL